MLGRRRGQEGTTSPVSIMPARGRSRGRGQSLVEFALILPLLLVLLAFGLDLGRVFLGWVNLNNSVKVAATYAAQNPNAWVSGTPNARTIEYQRLVTADADVINCDMPSPIPNPTFPSGRDIGDPAKVAVTCRFHLITPILSFVLGNGLDVSASSAFPIRSGVINGIPVQTAIPIADCRARHPAHPRRHRRRPHRRRDRPPCRHRHRARPRRHHRPPPRTRTASCRTWSAPTRSLPTKPGVRHGQGAGFLQNLIFNPQVGNKNNYTIGHQSLTPGRILPCATTSMTVSP